MEVLFYPQTLGRQEARLEVETDPGARVLSIPLRVRGTEADRPEFLITPASVAFVRSWLFVIPAKAGIQ